MKIYSTMGDIIARQKNQGTYKRDEFNLTPYNIGYWRGHVIEEIAELELSETGEEYHDEAADIIIFFQCLYHTCTWGDLTLDLSCPDWSDPKLESPSFASLVIGLAKALPYRKSWKTYKNVESDALRDWFHYQLIPFIIFSDEDSEEIYASYTAKIKYNETRADWDR